MIKNKSVKFLSIVLAATLLFSSGGKGQETPVSSVSAESLLLKENTKLRDEIEKKIREYYNIEIKNSKRPSKKLGKDIRDNIVEYASKIAESVTGRSDIPVYMSIYYNDVPTEDLKQERIPVKFIGHNSCENTYLDLYEGWEDTNDLKGKHTVYKLK